MGGGARMSESRTFRYGGIWMSTGILLIALSVVFPLLMRANHQRIDFVAATFFAAMAIAGIFFLIYFAVFRITVSETGMTVRGLFGTQTFDWSEVVAVRSDPKTICFVLAGERKLELSVFFPKVAELLRIASSHLPPAVWRDATAL